MDARQHVQEWIQLGLLTDIQAEEFELLWQQSNAGVVDVWIEDGVLSCVLSNGQTKDIYPATTLPDVLVTERRDKKPLTFLGISLKVWLGSVAFIALFIAAVLLIIKIRKK